jgi:hypothetical protein
MRKVWHTLTRQAGTSGDLPLLVNSAVSAARWALENEQKMFVEVVSMDKGAASLHTILMLDEGVPNPDEMEAAIRVFKVLDLNEEA